ncbi:MAG TPA: nuclear transport factor 2 family protein [Gammaproteobacteria bacterium]
MAADPPLGALEKIEIRLALEDLNSAFTRCLDHGDIDALVGLFTEDALYTHGARRSKGRKAIEALFRARTAAGPRTSRHLYSGLTLEIESRTRAAGTSVCMTFAQAGLPPLSPAVPILVADFHDVYVRGDDGRWLFESRRIERIFEDPSAGGPVGMAAEDRAARESMAAEDPGARESTPAGADRRSARVDRRIAGVDLSLEPPSTFLFTGEVCTRSYRLNRFAFDFKDPVVRERFAREPDALMSEYGLTEAEKALVRARDWTGLVAHGGHHFNVIKIAAAVGETHLHVGAHMRGTDWEVMKETLPRRIDLMPEDLA